MTPPPRIDPHVHARDEAWEERATIPKTLKLADDHGVEKIFDMPNVPNAEGEAVFDRERVKDRLERVPQGWEDRYFTYVGLTGDPEQAREAVWCYDNFPDSVVGFKLYAGHSTGNLGVTDPEDRRTVYETLAEIGYDGVLTVHCEDERLLQPELWDSENPETHADARPPAAEIASVQEQLTHIRRYEPDFNLVIAHTSTPEAVTLVNHAREEDGVNAFTEVTPHHVMWTRAKLGEGMAYKMNPPLRDAERVERLRDQLKHGDIDFIGTDHAPHTEQGKQEDYASGYPSLTLYSDFVPEGLHRFGLGDEEIADLTYHNIVDVFGDRVT